MTTAIADGACSPMAWVKSIRCAVCPVTQVG